MSAPDDYPVEMQRLDLSDSDIEDLLTGTAAPFGEVPVGGFIAELRSRYRDLGPVPVRTALAEFLEVGPTSGAAPSLEGAVPASRRAPVLTKIGVVAGTLTGKVVLGVTIAAAVAVGGAHASGLVELPVLPEVAGQQGAESPPEVPAGPDEGGGAEVPERTGASSPVQGPPASLPAAERAARPEASEPPASTVADRSAQTNGHGQPVSALARTTDSDGCEKGQEISALASSNASDRRSNPEQTDPCRDGSGAQAGGADGKALTVPPAATGTVGPDNAGRARAREMTDGTPATIPEPPAASPRTRPENGPPGNQPPAPVPPPAAPSGASPPAPVPPADRPPEIGPPAAASEHADNGAATRGPTG